MFSLATEIDKLSWYARALGREEVFPEDIKAAAVADTDYDNFAFSNAIMVGDKAKALEILSDQIKRKIAPTMIMGEITSTIGDMLTARLLADEGMRPAEIATKISKLKGSRVVEYKVKLCLQTGVGAEKLRSVMARCVQTDAAIKMSPNSYTEIERLICSL
jgi:DNA polymerase III delta subunit